VLKMQNDNGLRDKINSTVKRTVNNTGKRGAAEIARRCDSRATGKRLLPSAWILFLI